MKLPSNIKPYPTFFKYLPISDKGFATLMSKTIYLNKEIYADLQKANPKPFNVAVLKHQEVHIKNASLLKTLRFIFSRDFRMKEEIAAYSATFKHLKEHNESFDINNAARQLASVRYLWMTSYKEGRAFLLKIWKEA